MADAVLEGPGAAGPCGGIGGDGVEEMAVRVAFEDDDVGERFGCVVVGGGGEVSALAIGCEADAECADGALARIALVAGEQVRDVRDEEFLVDGLRGGECGGDSEEGRCDAVEAYAAGEEGDKLAVADELDAGEAHGGDEDDAVEVVEELEEFGPPEVANEDDGEERGVELGCVGIAFVCLADESAQVDEDIDGDDEREEDDEEHDDVREVCARDVSVDAFHAVWSFRVSRRRAAVCMDQRRAAQM